MFCTSCGSLVSSTSAACPVCQLPLARRAPAPPTGRSWTATLGRFALALLPVLVVVLAAGVGVQRWQDRQQQQEAVYLRAEAALAAGDFDAAELGFSALGGFRDAGDRLDQVQAVADPIQQQLDAALATIDAGDYTAAIEMLEKVIDQAPGFAAAADLLDSTRSAWIEQLSHDVSSAQANRDWLRAELALRELSTLRPGDSSIEQQLHQVVRDHATLAFSRDGAVLLVSPENVPERVLTPVMGAMFPSWSPDRSQIAFIATTEGPNRFRGTLMVMQSDGSDLRAVASDVLPYSWPVWSPDGAMIAYSSVQNFDMDDVTGAISLNVVDTASGVSLDLTGEQLPHATLPTWSPDGTEIAFISNTVQRRSSGGIDLQDGDVYTVPVAGGPVRDLTEGRVFEESWVQWSPAGGRLLIFTAPGDWASPAKSRLYLLDLTTEELDEIAIDEWQTSLPFWSPDGTQIAYVTGGDTINIWSDQGLQWVQLGSEAASFCAWSPDGRYIVVPPVDSSHAAFVVNVTDDFGTIDPFELDFDAMRSGNGPPVWGGVTPLAPRADSPPGS